MYLDVSKAFVKPTVEFPFETEVRLNSQQFNGDEISFDPVRLEGRYVMTDDTVHLRGTLRTSAHAPCAVCLKPVTAELTVSFAESFTKDANEEEDGLFRYEGKQLPLEHMVLTLVMLNLPMRFTCPEGSGCAAEGELTEWNEQETVWAEEEESGGTYRPFEGLDALLQNQPEQ